MRFDTIISGTPHTVSAPIRYTTDGTLGEGIKQTCINIRGTPGEEVAIRNKVAATVAGIAQAELNSTRPIFPGKDRLYAFVITGTVAQIDQVLVSLGTTQKEITDARNRETTAEKNEIDGM